MLIRVLPALMLSLLLAAGAWAISPRDQGSPLLPDLEQEAPSQLVITRAGGEYRLGFRSAVRNVGAGPLIISGHRSERSIDEMVADQVITEAGAPNAVVNDVGSLRYVVSPDHRHWHLLAFQRYALTTVGGKVVVRDRKTGFCLGDRYAATSSPEGKRYTSRCGLGQPARLGIEEGISPGYGDAYDANLEGQYLPLTGLPNGRYVLVHRVNGDGRLHELRADNDAASVLLSLRWRDGVPRVNVLAVCAFSARCR
ncbi:lysyl oxidase family protein [Solirubrobacter ginsenosidimutans]|uniref:Lysyl oxidase family protein n=1 Tax=Solirubrobacter ginsenosidimutans TaxID=490573 RepID=A0A9X3MPB2_9ACTN|nr:lysyl oxidase family protein [Solirubrobacter ginsenosidimutans]MDA0159912.1 lysyl oxidase family protein [Solirubrobacter ginsenosidimutans]